MHFQKKKKKKSRGLWPCQHTFCVGLNCADSLKPCELQVNKWALNVTM